jgi:signal transduction histidine kinase
LASDAYDLKSATNRTVVWVTLSALVVALYALVIAGVGSRFDAGGQRWLTWVAAAVVAVTFAPLRDALQRGINRLTFGRWDEPYEVLARLGEQLQASVDVERMLNDMVDELRVLGLTQVRLVDVDGQLLAGDVSADDGTARERIPVVSYGAKVGELSFDAPESALRARDQRLLANLASQLGSVMQASLLERDLQSARERLVLAREEERRRLRRDVHDGIGPALAGHLLRLEVIERKVSAGEDVRADLRALTQDVHATVLEARRVVEGLRPPAIDELGLSGALSQAGHRLMAGTGVQLEMDVTKEAPPSAAVEVACYRIVTEALTNVARHAAATQCSVAVDFSPRCVTVCVEDDGIGLRGARLEAGNGLQTMRERAEELSGQLHVTSGANGRGTRVTAVVPLQGMSGREDVVMPVSYL